VASERKLSAGLALFLFSFAALAAIGAYRLFVPGQPDPLPILSTGWRLSRAVLDFAAIFPAVALTALTAAFGFAAAYEGEERRFSPRFLEAMTDPLVTAIAAAVVYALLAFLFQPLALEYRADLAARGSRFGTALAQAEAAVAVKNWHAAARAVAVCERIWPDSPPSESLRDTLDVHRAEIAAVPAGAPTAAAWGAGPSLPGAGRPVDVLEALRLAEAAIADGRPFDAHWYAEVAARLATRGSPEAASAVRLAAAAWNAVAALEPSADEAAAYSVYNRKRDGYQAISAGDWLRAYYIFEGLAAMAPNDPDVKKYLAMATEGAASVAFFIDEVGSALGGVAADSLLSLPLADGGRAVLRIGSLQSFADAAYAGDLEILLFDAVGRPSAAGTAAYAKLMPFNRAAAAPETLILFTALDRTSPDGAWSAEWTGVGAPADERLALPIAFEEFLLAVKAGRGVDALSVQELQRGLAVLDDKGYPPIVLRAELYRRVVAPFAFLALAILMVAYGWRLRATRPAGLVGALALAAMPFIADAIWRTFRTMSDTAALAAVAAWPPAAAASAIFGLQAVLLLGALVFLAGQRG
jgi:hypothetical protein